MNDPNDGPVVKKRKPWLAALLSWLVPGLGQLYNGQWAKAVAFAAAGQVIIFVSGMWLLSSVAGMVAIPFIDFFLILAAAIEALVSAYRSKDFTARWFNRVGWYAAFVALVVVMFAVNRGVTVTIGVENYQVPAESMKPTIVSGDRIAVTKRIANEIRRNELLVFRSPYDDKTLVKRCVAGGLDTVEVRHKMLIVNGQPADEPFVQHSDDSEYQPPGAAIDRTQFQQHWEQGKLDQTFWVRDNFGPVVVPPGHLFMLGDNRDNSYDSRFWGPVDRTAVIGKPLYIYFSNDIKRIGMTLR